jgi:ring-1,2-phenylacetyl-CoA epoxidase subunit PaaD
LKVVSSLGAVRETDVIDALRTVDDPEYPGVSVVDMGMINAVELTGGRVAVELITTFSGCPATDVISSEIAAAVGALDGIIGVEVRRSAEAWDASRLSEHARTVMARDFTVAVAGPGKPAECPRCRAAALVEQSPFGPARCRAVHRCTACGEVVEVLRA